MSIGIQYDEIASRRIEAMYITSDVVAQRQAVVKMLDLRPGQRILDVGSGPGLLAYELGSAVGETGTVSGIDFSENMVALAERRCASLPWVKFRVGDATTLPYPDGDFDAAVATQVYNYFKNLPAALREMYRVLRPRGRALILETDWDTLIWNTTDRERMQRVLAAWTEHCEHPYLPRKLAPMLRDAGFLITHQTIFPLFNPQYDTDTYSHGIIEFIASSVPGRQGVTAEEAQAWANELQQRRQENDYFFSLNRYLFLVVKPEMDSA